LFVSFVPLGSNASEPTNPSAITDAPIPSVNEAQDIKETKDVLYPLGSGNAPELPALSRMNRSHASRRKRSILAVIARRLSAFYKSLLDDSVKDAHELFDRAAQQK
jgi:hypothetical protein